MRQATKYKIAPVPTHIPKADGSGNNFGETSRGVSGPGHGLFVQQRSSDIGGQ